MIKTKKEYDELPVIAYKDYCTPGFYRLPAGKFDPNPPFYRIYEVLGKEKAIVQYIIELEDK